jgi:hypothetical protein
LHLLPLDVDEEDTKCWTEQRGRWTAQRGQTKVTVTLRVLRTDLRRRIEDLRVCLLVRRGSKELRLRHEFQFRIYTAGQFRRLRGSIPSLELCNIYDFRYDIEQPFALNDEMAYSMFCVKAATAIVVVFVERVFFALLRCLLTVVLLHADPRFERIVASLAPK